MPPSRSVSTVLPQRLSLGDTRLYWTTAVLVLGNLLLPMALHRIPDAGRAFMPILFFTLVGAWRLGAQAGLLTALLSPLVSHWLTGMPPTPMLQVLILQSVVLALLAALAAARWPRATLPSLFLVVLASQILFLTPQLTHGSSQAALASFQHRLPAMLLQILGGFALLHALDRLLAPKT